MNSYDIDSLAHRLSNELTAARQYLALADEESDACECKCLIAMARDEYQHAEVLLDRMMSHGEEIPKALRDDCMQVKQLLATFR